MLSRRLWFLVVAALALMACVDRPAEDATGQEIYLEVCARCHAPDLSGGVGPALGPDSVSASQPVAFMEDAIVNGRGRMPSFANTLSETQIDRVLQYLLTEQGRS